jgi:hypothetical protein
MRAFTTNPSAGPRLADISQAPRKPFGQTNVFETATLIASQPTPEAQRIGVYVLAAVFGLLVCGVISVAKELRQEAADRP